MVMPEEEMEAQDEPAPAPRGAFVEPTELVLRTADQTFEVPDASEVGVDIWTFDEDTVGDWHTHGAPVLVIVNSGQFTRQYEDCSTSVYEAGEVSIHPGQPVDRLHRAHLTAGTVLGLVLFGVPPGEAGAATQARVVVVVGVEAQDVRRALEYLRSTGAEPDDRCAEAIDLVASRRDEGHRWPLENTHQGPTLFEMEGPDGFPSRWNTLRARRVLRWAGSDVDPAPHGAT
jgi:quercetin dioxygenase-like cupin family protein